MVPDIVGLKLNKAKEILNKSGIINYEIKLTSPPWVKEKEIDEEMRVIRISKDNESKIVILVCK